MRDRSDRNVMAVTEIEDDANEFAGILSDKAIYITRFLLRFRIFLAHIG